MKALSLAKIGKFDEAIIRLTKEWNLHPVNLPTFITVRAFTVLKEIKQMHFLTFKGNLTESCF